MNNTDSTGIFADTRIVFGGLGVKQTEEKEGEAEEKEKAGGQRWEAGRTDFPTRTHSADCP